MSAAQTAHELTALAQSRTVADRERLVLAIVDLCARAAPDVRSPRVQALLDPIFVNLITDAEFNIRLRLAEKLASTDWAPPRLISMLAHDKIDIARTIIAQSPVLGETDMLDLLSRASVEHHIEVARRPYVGSVVVETILRQGEPEVLTALAGNETADVSQDAMRRLVQASRAIAGMRSPLARHPRLTTDLAAQLYVWVGDLLRSAIVARFQVDAKALDAAIADAVKEAAEAHGEADAGPQEEMERRLIAKLHAAGQLRPSYLLRALREQRLSLFETALATLGDYSPAAVRRAVNAEQPDLLALACAGVGVDRVVFTTVLGSVKALNHGRPVGNAELVRKTFDGYSAEHGDKARAAFRKIAV